MSGDEVGLWYVFGGIAGLCGMVELGFAANISRFTSFYLAGLKGMPDLKGFTDEKRGVQANHAGLLGLIRMSTSLYALFAKVVLILMIFGGGGWLFYNYTGAMKNPINWIAYLLYSIGIAYSLSNYFWMAILPASNRIVESQKIQINGIFINYIITFLGVFLNYGIFGLTLGQIAMNLYQRQHSRALFNRFNPLDQKVEPLPILWKHLWPMTWRGGLMGYGIYLSLSVTVLICAQVFDLKTTASYAISLQLVLMAYSLANSWLVVKWPTISALYVQGDLAAIRKLVSERIILQMASYVIICAFGWQFAPLLLQLLKAKTNFMCPTLLLLLMISGAVDLLVHSISAVVQTGNQFPFVYSKLINGFLTVALAFFLGKWLGMVGLVCAPFIAQMTFNGWYISWWCWRDLHRERPQQQQEIRA